MRTFVLVLLLALAGCDSSSAGGPDGKVKDSGTDLGRPDAAADLLVPSGWAFSAGGAGKDNAAALAIDGAGHVVVIGYFEDQITFGNTTLTAHGGPVVLPGVECGPLGGGGTGGLFVLKLDADDGTVIWAVDLPGVVECPHKDGLALDAAGNIYVAASFKGTATCGSTSLTAAGDEDVLVVKLDPSGAVLWATSAGGAGIDDGNGIAVDSAGNTTITGSFQGTASFGSTSLVAEGGMDAFVARLDPSGAFLWAVRAGGPNDPATGWPWTDHGGAVALDAAGNSHVLGRYVGAASFGDSGLSVTIAKGSGPDQFVAKLDPTGTFLWAAAATDQPLKWMEKDLRLDSAGNVYIAGGVPSATGSYNAAAAKISPAGAFLWCSPVMSDNKSWGQAIAARADGGSLLSGRLWGTASFGSAGAITAQGDGDAFVALFDASGKITWGCSAGGPSGYADGIAVAGDGAGNIYVAGELGGAVVMDGTSLTSAGKADMFVWKIPASGF